MKAIDIIHAEHRALGAVVQAFRFVLDGIHEGRFKPDFALLGALNEYITEVPDKLHHPKEDDYLRDHRIGCHGGHTGDAAHPPKKVSAERCFVRLIG
ncbi:MAG: hypothetical protein ABI606_10630 [Rhodoferax sp.]